MARSECEKMESGADQKDWGREKGGGESVGGRRIER
jgi:hypothetical protein